MKKIYIQYFFSSYKNNMKKKYKIFMDLSSKIIDEFTSDLKQMNIPQVKL